MKLLQNKVFQIISTILLGCIAALAALEFYRALPSLALVLGKNTLEWRLAISGIVVFLVLFFFDLLFLVWFPEKSKQIAKSIIALREKLKSFRWFLAVLVAGLPALVFLYFSFGLAYPGLLLRFLLFITASLFSAVIITSDQENLLQQNTAFFGFLLVGSLFAIGAQLLTVINYPFSLTWSEGNRLYDYSLYFGGSRYTLLEEIKITRGAHGRNLLWGLPFIIPNSPIWLHRLWNVILITVPYLILGYLMTRWNKFNALAKWVFTLWTFLFLLQSSVYTPLLLSAWLVVFFVRPKHFLISLIAVAIAGFYASSSRWTWLPAPAAWSVLILISQFEIKKDEKILKTIQKLVPIGIIAVAGLVGGMFANDKLFSPKEISSSTTMSQPLLWYRLLPNATYPEGILLGLLIAALPLIAILIWLIVSKRWSVNWLQALAYLVACAGFLAIGLVASVKIGGGNNLHNLDMFFVTLAILAGLALFGKNNLGITKWPLFGQALLFLTLFIPSWYAVKAADPLQLPTQNQAQEALRVIEKRTTQSAKRGEVLFLDQRQLLTFGFIQDMPLVTDYEKRYVMDKAMAGKVDYFAEFYQDLADKRFSMIVTDPIFASEKNSGQTFGDENNAWVKWVAEPLLCYYAPTRMLPEVNVQLLTPREEPKNCPDYAIPK
jgi:hypothetical protein